MELRCAPSAHDGPGTCETPRVPSSDVTTMAVGEFVGIGPLDEALLLLRAGSERALDPRD